MKKRLFLLPFLLLGSLIQSVYAGDEGSSGYPKRGLGFAAGEISGFGLSYKQHLNHYVTQGTFGLKKNESEFDVNAGFMIQRTFHTTVLTGDSLKIAGLVLRTRFYAVTGLGYFRERREWKEYDYQVRPDPNPPLLGIHREVRTSYRTGAGIGMEFIVYRRVGIAIDGEYTFSFKSVDITGPNQPGQMYNGEEGLEIEFLPQIAAHYYF
jgi:hypothetical protein